jgi:hypothetical protein
MPGSEDETRGIALAGQLVAFQTILCLVEKRLITKKDAVTVFERTLTGLEAYPHFDRAVEEARRILDQMAQIVSSSAKTAGRQ